MLIPAMGGRTVSSFLLASSTNTWIPLLGIHQAASLKQNSWRHFTWRQGIKHSARKEPMRAFLTHDPNKKDRVNVLFSNNIPLDEPV